MLVLGPNRRLRLRIVHRREDQIVARGCGEDRASFEHAAIGFQYHLDILGKRCRNKNAGRKSGDTGPLLEEGTAFGRDTHGTVLQVIAERRAVLISLLAGAATSRFAGGILTLGLPTFDLHITFLGLDGSIGFLVVGKQLPPLGLLLGGHFAPVG